MLARMSIRAKISIVVTFLLLSMSGLGVLAIVKMRSINANTVDIQTSWLPSVRLLGELRAGVTTYRNAGGKASQREDA
jgi:methyl-accepting chemotaxis protein